MKKYTIHISNPGTFRTINRNLEILQEFKAPLVKTFETLICGNPATYQENFEFNDVQPLDHFDVKIEKWVEEKEATEDNIAKQFYKLAGLLNKFEREQKKDLVQFAIKKKPKFLQNELK